MNNHDLAMKAARRIINEMGNQNPVARMAAIIQETYGSQQPREAPEPERPEPKYQEGQWVEVDSAGRPTVVRERWWKSEINSWVYRVAFASGVLGDWPETRLSPHTMTLYDVPPEVCVALIHRKPVRVVEHPVYANGTPMRPGSAHTEASRVGETVNAYALSDKCPCALKTADGGLVYLWNIKVAEGE